MIVFNPFVGLARLDRLPLLRFFARRSLLIMDSEQSQLLNLPLVVELIILRDQFDFLPLLAQKLDFLIDLVIVPMRHHRQKFLLHLSRIFLRFNQRRLASILKNGARAGFLDRAEASRLID